MTTPIKIEKAGKYLAPTSTSSRVEFRARSDGQQVLVYNSSNELAFIAFGTDDVTAVGGTSAPDIPVPPGTVQTFTCPAWATHVAAITDSGTAALYILTGEGA